MPQRNDEPRTSLRAPIDPEPNGGSEPDFTPPNLAITEPVEWAQVAAGTSVTLKGTASDSESGVLSVKYSLDGGALILATRSLSTWSASITIPARGNHSVQVRCTDRSGNVATRTRNLVGIDTTPPELLVDQPGPEVVDAVIKLVARARDNDALSNVKAVRWSLDGVNFADAAKSGDAGDGWSIWTADITIPSRGVPPNGATYTLTVRAYNLDDKFNPKQVSFKAVDRTNPRLEITNPPPDVKEVPGTASGATVQLRGTTSDTYDATKLYSSTDRVECILDGKTSIPVAPKATGDWSSWSANVLVPGHDEHTVTVRCYDKQGNKSEVSRSFVVALPFEA